MCTYVTEHTKARGSGKGARGWFPVSDVQVYFDHPVHAADEHTLNIDFTNPSRGAGERVAVELSAETALDLVGAVAAVFTRVPEDLTGIDPAGAARLLEVVRELSA